MRLWALLLVSFMCVPQAYAQETGLPLPRFASLNSGEVNLRTGPGTRYPITWVYHKKGLPVEIVHEFETWRQIRDMNGDQGWVHQSMLAGKRMALTVTSHKGPKMVALYQQPNPHSAINAKLTPHVLVQLNTCQPAWCEAEVQGFIGWILKKQLWGVYDAESWD